MALTKPTKIFPEDFLWFSISSYKAIAFPLLPTIIVLKPIILLWILCAVMDDNINRKRKVMKKCNEKRTINDL